MSMDFKDQQRKLTTTPLSGTFEPPTLLPRRKKYRSPKKKPRSSTKLTKEEVKYQRFVHDLKKDVEVHMKQCMRESRFDTRDDQYTRINLPIQVVRIPAKSKQVHSTTGCRCCSTGTNTLNAPISNRQDVMSFLKYNETKRLAADVQTILTGPAMKQFYTQFIHPSPRQHSPIPLEESFFNLSEQY